MENALMAYTVADKGIIERAISKWERTQLAENAISLGRAVIHPRYADTLLNRLAVFEVPIDFDERNFFRAGALEQFENFIIFSDRQGNISTYDTETNHIDFRRGTVPMNWGIGRESVFADAPNFNADRVRVTDLLILDKDQSDSQATLLVAHHRFRLDCIEFVGSRVTISIENSLLRIVDDTWETFFRPGLCLEPQPGNQAFEGHQSGGRMVSYGQAEILITTGDYEFDGASPMRPRKVSMDPRSPMGKLFRVDLATGNYDVVADGLRNPQGLTIAADGRIFETEHGPQGGDEVNLISFGSSYGWPEVTLGTAYGRLEPWPSNPRQGRHDGFRMPIYAFVPSIGISNLVSVTNTDGFTVWDGDLLVTSLNGATIYRLRLEDNIVLYQEAILEAGMRIRDIIMLGDGAIAALGDNGSLFLIREATNIESLNKDVNPFSPIEVTGYDEVPRFETLIGEQTSFSDRGTPGRTAFNANCSACHGLDNVVGIGPPLNGIIGKDVASFEGYAYSPALAAINGSWTEERLVDYVLDPDSVAPNGRMAAVEIDEETASSIASYLETVPEDGL